MKLSRRCRAACRAPSALDCPPVASITVASGGARLCGALLLAAALACGGDARRSGTDRPARPTGDSPIASRPTDLRCPEGDAGLIDAAFRGDRDRVALCLAAGVSIDAVDRSGASALDHAALHGHAPLVRYLLERGATVVQDGKRNPLAAAAREGHVQIVDLLLAAGADPSASWLDKPALIHAIDRRRHDVALDLIDAGANIHDRDRAGRSVLAAAVDAADRALVDTLLTLGADPTEPCPGGSPLDRAKARPDLSSIARRLEAAAGAGPAATTRASEEDEVTTEEEAEVPADDDPYAKQPPPDLQWPPPPRSRP